MNKFFSAYKKAFRICLNCEKNNEWLCKVFIVQKSEFIPNFAQKLKKEQTSLVLNQKYLQRNEKPFINYIFIDNYLYERTNEK